MKLAIVLLAVGGYIAFALLVCGCCGIGNKARR